MSPAFLIVFSFFEIFLIIFLDANGKMSKNRLSKTINVPKIPNTIDSVILHLFCC